MTNASWPRYLSATEVESLLGLTPIEFRRILDDGEIETDREDDRENSLHKWRKSHDPYERFTYFTEKLIQSTQISVQSLLRYAQGHNIYLSIDTNGCIVCKKFDFNTTGDDSKDILLCKDRIVSLEATIQELKAENARLCKERENQIPKTTNATIARLKADIERLKQDCTDAVRLACEIVKRGPKGNGLPWTEAEIQDLAAELKVSLKGDRMELFKKGMPDHLVKKTPGARRIS